MNLLSRLILLGLFAPLFAGSQTDLGKIENAALDGSRAYSYLEELSNGIGPRLTGSPAAEKATNWAQSKMESIGLKNVHRESWILPRGWERWGAQAQLVRPFRLPLNIASYGWSGSTKPGGTEADVIAVNSDRLLEEAGENAAQWSGKILLLTPAEPAKPMRANSQLAAFALAAAEAHAVAVIKHVTRPGVMTTHSEPLAFPVSFSKSFPSIAVVDIAEEQQKLIEWLLKSGRPVRIRINVENRFSARPVESANIVGEIPGYEHPEQVVIVAAHLDSWDLGTGAIDDGFGTAAILAAAEAILKSGVKPRRTIRFILFTGEEQGLLGSNAYVRKHWAELGNVLCAFALDWGQGPVTKFPVAGHAELLPALERFSQLIGDVQKVQIEKGYLFSTDAYSFTLAGVPGLAAFQDSPGYSATGHSASDTLDKVDPEILVRDSEVIALAAFWVADAPERLGEFWPPEKTAQALTRDHQRSVLELLGMWPFLQ